MSDKIIKPAISLCLQCNEWREFSIKANGWWKPSCNYWNQKKSTKECLYGPKKGCKYTLEYCLLDDRRNFKLYNGETFLPLVQYIYDNKDEIRLSKYGSYDMFDSKLFIYRDANIFIKKKSSFKNVLDWINETILRGNGKKSLSHYRRYDRIQKTKGGGKWESVQIEEKIVKK